MNQNSKVFHIIPVAVYCLSLVVNTSPGEAPSQELKNIEKAGPRTHPLRSRRQIESMLALAPKSPAVNELRELNIVLLADEKDHGPNEHDYPLWQKRWLLLLGGKQAGASSETHANLYGPPRTIGFIDEAYWPFRGDTDKIKVLASSPKTTSRSSFSATVVQHTSKRWTFGNCAPSGVDNLSQ